MRRRRFVLGLMACLIALVSMVRAVRAQTFVYATEAGVTFNVTAEGLSRITHGAREIAAGGWYAWNAGPLWFGRGAEDEPLALAPHANGECGRFVREKSLEILAADHARVRHVLTDAEAVFDYRFSGEDVVITARLDNRHATRPISMPAFGGLRFAFGAEPQGEMRVWHASYLRAIGPGAFHPSHNNKIGGSYAIGEGFGVGLAPVLRGLDRTLLFWDYDRWNPDAPERRANRWLSYVRSDPIPPGGALTFGVVLRASPSTDWRRLLQPYKEQFRAAFGEKRYAADFRSVGVAHVNRNKEAISPANPYGFHGGFRRLDRAEEVEKLCDTLIPALQRMNGIGLIFWGQGGQEPRGEMYRADFDILPPEVAANWPRLAGRFREAGLALGVTARPRHIHLRKDWENDLTLDINPDDPRHLEMLWQRFKNMIDRGVTLFYLDSFGNEAADVKTMRYLRERMGPDIQTFAEHSCDVMAVYSAFYSETDFYAKGSRDWATEDQWSPRIGLRFLEIVNWLVGPVPCISRAYDIHGKIPEGFESSAAFFFRNGLAPMVEDYQIPQFADSIRKIQDQYVTKDGKLKTPNPEP